jgi:hypothetical protein
MDAQQSNGKLGDSFLIADMSIDCTTSSFTAIELFAIGASSRGWIPRFDRHRSVCVIPKA